MQKVNFGCGLATAPDWENFDASPTLRLQRLPVIGPFARQFLRPCFPSDVRYGDVARGLPVSSSSVGLVYCSHVLEHLALEDFRRALAEVARILVPGGVFRGVLPDFEIEARRYLTDTSPLACSRFMERTYLGLAQRPRGLNGLLRGALGNSQHLWMWDFKGLKVELISAGFLNIRRAEMGDSRYHEFRSVEDRKRWHLALGFECCAPR